MGLVEKAGAVALAVALLGGGVWYAAERIQSQAETIGTLEAEQRQMRQDLEDSLKSAENVRAQLEMWQWLYEDLQAGFTEIRQDREQMSAELRGLKEQTNVKEYLDCPMPDDLYDWVREN